MPDLPKIVYKSSPQRKFYAVVFSIPIIFFGIVFALIFFIQAHEAPDGSAGYYLDSVGSVLATIILCYVAYKFGKSKIEEIQDQTNTDSLPVPKPTPVSQSFTGSVKDFMKDFSNTIPTSKADHQLSKQFAETNALTYQANMQLQNLDGEFFLEHQGYTNPSYFDFVSGTENQILFIIFTYERVVQARGPATILDQTVMRLQFTNPLPHLFLQSHTHKPEYLKFCNGDNPQAHLDENLDEYFTLWTVQGLQTEGLQIFTAEFTKPLAAKWNDCHIEFINNHIYVYPAKFFDNQSDLARILDLAKYLTTDLPQRIKEMRSDVEAMESYIKN